MTSARPVALVTGSTRGIGKAIAIKLAQQGYNLVITGKTTEPHPTLRGTIYTTAQEIRDLGVEVLAIPVDVREDLKVADSINQIQSTFGRLDVLVNNASAISLSGTEATPMKKFDLMHEVNARGTFMYTQAALPLLKKAPRPHILMMSPPLNLQPKWFKPHVAYSMSKMGMSLCVLGMSAEFRDVAIGINALWPRTIIATAAIQNNFPPEFMRGTRHPEIVADAAWAIIQRDPATCTGNYFIDEEVLKQDGVTDFSKYAFDPNFQLFDDLFMEPHEEIFK